METIGFVAPLSDTSFPADDAVEPIDAVLTSVLVATGDNSVTPFESSVEEVSGACAQTRQK